MIKASIYFFLFSMCFIPLGQPQLFEGYSSDNKFLSKQIIDGHEALRQCTSQIANKLASEDKLIGFMNEFTCRTSKDPIEHCLCLERVFKDLSKSDKESINQQLTKILMYDAADQDHLRVEYNAFQDLSGIYQMAAAGTADLNVTAVCEKSVADIKDRGCINTINHFQNSISTQKRIIGKDISKSFDKSFEEQNKILHTLFKSVIKNNIDISKVNSMSSLISKVMEKDPAALTIPEMDKFNSFSRYLVDDGTNAETNKSKNARFKRLMNLLIEKRGEIEDVNNRLSGNSGKIDMASDKGFGLFKNVISGFAKAEIKYTCDKIFSLNAAYYCAKELDKYDNAMSELDLNTEKYAELLNTSLKKSGISESLVTLGVEGLYCSRLSDRIKDNKEMLFNGDLPKNCKTPICNLINKRIKSGVSLEQVQSELTKISKMAKTSDIKITKTEIDNKSNVPTGPVFSKDRDEERKNTVVSMSDVFSQKLGYSHEQVEKALIEVKKSSPEVAQHAVEKLSNAESSSASTHILPSQNQQQISAQNQQVDQRSLAQQQQQQQMQQMQTHMERGPVEKSYYNRDVAAAKPVSTINMHPDLTKHYLPKETEVPDTTEKFVQPSLANAELEQLKEEYSKLKTEMEAPAVEKTAVVKKGAVERNRLPAQNEEYAQSTKNAVSSYAPSTRSEGGNKGSASESSYSTASAYSSASAPAGSSGGPAVQVSAASAAGVASSSQGLHLTVTNKDVYTLTADDLEKLKNDPSFIQNKFKNEDQQMPELFSVSDGEGGQKYLKAVYTLGKINEFKEVDITELCKAKIITKNCEARTLPKKTAPAKRQYFKVRDLDQLIEKSTRSPMPGVLNSKS